MSRRGLTPTTPARLLALDIYSGEVVWQSDVDIFGTWLGYSVEHDILVEGGSYARDRAADEARNKMAAYQAATGLKLWSSNSEYQGKPMLHGTTIYGEQGRAFELLTGNEIKHTHPMTKMSVAWEYKRNYGCNTPIGGMHLLLFRSAAAGFNDLSTDGGTGNWGGFRSGCTANLIPADGVLNAPDYTRTCTCSYQNQCSLAMVPMPDVELWTFQKLPNPTTAIESLAINLGAPGDWPAGSGRLWFEYPIVGGDSPTLGVTTRSGTPRYYTHHSLLFAGSERQVAASGVEGAVKYEVDLKSTGATTYNVRLIFAEPESAPTGPRRFNVILQGSVSLANFDVAAAAGGVRRTVVREFQTSVAQGGKLTIELAPVVGSVLPPILSGWEISRVN